jgi:repressor LexA
MAGVLTLRQKEILDFLRRTVLAQGFPPTVREIAERFGIVSLNAVRRHLLALERKGHVELNPCCARGIRVLGVEHGRERPMRLPLLGRVAAGNPSAVWDDPEEVVELSPELWSRDHNLFMVRVKGDSMVPEFHEDDLLVVKAQQSASPGDVVVAVVDSEVTVKRLVHKNGKPVLRANNPVYPDIKLGRNAFLNGKVVGLIRRY